MKYFSQMNFCVFVIIMVLITSPVFADFDSPRKQMKRGISAEDVLCNTDRYLVIRNSGNAACVKLDTAHKLEKMGMLIAPVGFTKSEQQIETIPASVGTIINFYITDDDLNLFPNAAETVSTEGLFEFIINGVRIQGPETMIETGSDTGKFYLRLNLPDTVNGKPLEQDDIVLIRYLDESDRAGNQRVLVESFPLSKTFATVQTSGGGSRIGHEFVVRIYEPDANRDSKDEDHIPLSQLEFRAEGGIRTTLANPRFNANSGSLIETGPNTNIFEVMIEIPREVDGKVIHIGYWYEIRYIDRSTPSGTEEKIILKGRIG